MWRVLNPCVAPGINLTGAPKGIETCKHRDTDKAGWVLRRRSRSTPEAQRVYYIQLNGEVELLQLLVHREAGY